MRRKYLATLAVVTALITSVVPVYADYSKAGDTGSQEISSSFDVSADDFGGLIVSIPNDIPLSYDKESNAYSGQDYVKVSGYLDSDLRIKITAPDTIKFTNDDSKLSIIVWLACAGLFIGRFIL